MTAIFNNERWHRFKIVKGDTTVFTDWEDEAVRVGPTSTAPQRLAQLRAAHGPEARISIERETVPPRAAQERVRFSVKEKDGAIRYSNAVMKSEADAVEAEIRRDYPKAEITREGWVR